MVISLCIGKYNVFKDNLMSAASYCSANSTDNQVIDDFLDRPHIKIVTKVFRDVTFRLHQKLCSVQVPSQPGLIPHSLKLHFEVLVENIGGQPSFNVIVDNPIPPGTTYALGSATSDVGLVFCSSDNGTNFHTEKDQLTAHRACTHIRWRIPRIKAGGSENLYFDVVVESAAHL